MRGGPITNLRQLRGVIPPMATFFTEDGSIDVNEFQSEARFLRAAGVNGIVVGGSTGEGASLSADELGEIVTLCIEAVEGTIPVLAGVIADTSREAVRLARAAQRAGAVGLQIPPPHFYPVTDAKILASYYRAATDETGLPLIIYNVIPWAQVAIDSLQQLCSENPLIIGVKQSGYNIHALAELLANLRGVIRIYSAIDDLLYPSFMLGSDGTISGTSSLFPRETIAMFRCVEKGKLQEALRLHNAILPVWRTIEGTSFPGRFKYALKLRRRSSGKPRAPFSWPTKGDAERIEAALRAGGFLNGSYSDDAGQPMSAGDSVPARS
ncbi:MAG: dihydrodipicolinate synthase family protein [Acidobacteriota bacterium]